MDPSQPPPSPLPGQGLSNPEAAELLARHGPNEIPSPPQPGIARRILSELSEPLTIVLAVAGLGSWLLLGQAVEGAAILAIVAINTAFGVWQRRRADLAIAALRTLTSERARVVRDGVRTMVDARHLVVGDLIDIEGGDRVPADARLEDAAGLALDESLLTGESEPVHKTHGGLTDRTLPPGDQTGHVFAGTHAVRGRATARILATGARTHLGRIASSLGSAPPAPLERELKQVARRLAVLAAAAGLIVALVGVLRTPAGARTWAEPLQAGLALAVAAVPEGLVVAITAALALGARRMANEGTIVRRMEAIEGLGSTDVLCVDKTGTITTGRLTLVRRHFLPDHERAFWDAAWRCHNVRDGHGDPIEVSILADARAHDQEPPLGDRVAERPFDASTRSMTTVHRTPDGPILSLKGAPEVVLGRCRTGPDLDALGSIADEWTREGLRVLAFADARTADLDARDLRPLGVVGFQDPPRPTAAEAVRACRRAGIRIVMVTGDHLRTAQSIARAVGLDDEPAVTGPQLEAMAPDVAEKALAEAAVVARVEPWVKVRLVEAHRARGDVVAMTGDGVNDAPALRQADVGVALAGEGGTAVAREAADLVVTNDDLGILVRAVGEGRTISNNVRTVLSYLLIGNASEVALVFAALVAFPEIAVPLLPVQILWINLVTDGFPALALGADRPPGDPLAQPQRTQGQALLSSRWLMTLALMGAAGGLVVLLSGLAGRAWGWTIEELRSQLVLSLVSAHLALAYAVRGNGSAFAPGWARNRALLAATVGSLGIHVTAMLAPVGQTVLDVVPVPAAGWVLAAATALATLLIVPWLHRRSAAWAHQPSREPPSRA